jgi:hypothetical protein
MESTLQPSASSPDTVIATSGLSQGKGCEYDSFCAGPSIGKLKDLDVALVNVAECLRTIRGLVEAASRRRAFLNAAVRGNLVELADGQFACIQDDTDRCNMIHKVFEADQAFTECSTVFHLAVAKTMNGLNSIKDENMGAVNFSGAQS